MPATANIAILFTVFAPFLAALVAPQLQRVFEAWTGWLAALVPGVSFVLLLGLSPQASAGAAVQVEWAPFEGIGLDFRADGLALLFALTISGIGTLIFIYAAQYLRGHPHQGRFFAFLLGFTGAMQGLVLVDSTVGLYAFWELTSIASFLLIGFDGSRVAARRAAVQALVVTSIGGLALLLAAIILQRLTGSWTLSGIAAAGIDLRAVAAYPVVLGLVLLAAFTKSAQLPFHFWLPNAMEAPTPVSAFLHSATMVQGGVYLLARLSPDLGATPPWSTLLIVFGGATMLWGGFAALRQTDLKQMLAQTTVASLGLLVLLLGVGGETTISAALLYFLAHALYKAAMFMVVGNIDHEAGTRDITALGGLRDQLTITFIAAVLAAVSMVGLPPVLGYIAKEEIYLGVGIDHWQGIATLLALVLGNALVGAVGFAVLKPFMGRFVMPPKDPHEAPVAMLLGPGLLAVVGVAASFFAAWIGASVLAPAVASVLGEAVESHLSLHFDLGSIALWLSLATWALAALLVWQLARIRTLLRRLEMAIGWSFDRGFDAAMFGLVRLGAAVTRVLHHGRLELYLVVVFAALAAAVLGPLLLLDGWPVAAGWPMLELHEAALVLVAVAGIAAVLLAKTRLFAILALGVQGLALALLFLMFGAPDLSFTQLMVEVLSVVILALVMTRLQLQREDPREFEDLLRDGGLAVLCGAGITMLLLRALEEPFNRTLSDFFDAQSVASAHGHNIVNVIIVDFRGLDTLGEISVVMAAGIAILALIRSGRTTRASAPPKPPRRARKRAVPALAAEPGPSA